MHLEHKIIGGILMGLLLAVCIFVGIFVVRRLLDLLPLAKFKLMPLFIVILLLCDIASYYLDNFMSNGHESISGKFISGLPLYLMFILAWITSYVVRKQKPA